MLINDFLKRVSVAEILTLVFILSVGISLLYKYALYEELGIGWYIYSLSPQQIFLSSMSFTFFCLLGVIFGAVIPVFREHWFAIFIILMLIMIGLFFANALNLTNITNKLGVLLISAIIFMGIIKMHFFSTSKDGEFLREIPVEKLNFWDKNLPIIFSLTMTLVFLAMIYVQGTRVAKYILEKPYSQSIVKLKDKSDKWILIEMNGDKVLLMKYGVKREFKIIEYKEIESFKVN